MLTDILKAIRAGWKEARREFRGRRWLRAMCARCDDDGAPF